MSDDRLDRLRELIESALERIRRQYVEPDRMRLTLVIRHADHSDGSQDVVVSDDSYGGVQAALAQRFAVPRG